LEFPDANQQKKDLQYLLGQYRHYPKGLVSPKIEEDPRTVILGLLKKYPVTF
jgi:hypothetical protein